MKLTEPISHKIGQTRLPIETENPLSHLHTGGETIEAQSTENNRSLLIELFANLGLKIFPVHYPIFCSDCVRCSCGNKDCNHVAKHPYGSLAPQGFKNATADIKQLNIWFHDRRLNVGIATGIESNILVLDIDPRNGGDQSICILEAKYGALPSTWRFNTGGGGEHIIFRYPSIRISSSKGKLGEGIDVKSDGGYIVAPPSIHKSGQSYAISLDHNPIKTDIAELPDWLINKLSQPVPFNRPLSAKNTSDCQERIFEGNRNNHLTKIVGSAIAHNSPEEAWDFVRWFNANYFCPPLSECEVKQTFLSILKLHNNKGYNNG